MKPEVKIGLTAAEVLALFCGKEVPLNKSLEKYPETPDVRLAVARERTPGGSAIKLEIKLTSLEKRETVPLLQISSKSSR